MPDDSAPPPTNRFVPTIGTWLDTKKRVMKMRFEFGKLNFNDRHTILFEKIKQSSSVLWRISSGTLRTDIPSWLLHRNVQMLLDSGAAVTALWMAYLLRFDF